MVAVTGKSGRCRTSALYGVEAGTLDDTSWLTPDAHYWTRSKQAWTPLPGGIPCYETHE